MKLFEDHCGTAVQKVDFAHGSPMCKVRFGDESFHGAPVRIYRLGGGGVFANFLAGIDELGLVQKVRDALAGYIGRLTPVCRQWRKQLPPLSP